VQSKPWITHGIRTSIQIKNKFYTKYLKTKYQFYFDRFKFYRNKINHLTRVSKKQYYNNYFIKNTSNGQQLWKGIKQIINVNNKCNPAPNKIIENGSRELSDPGDIAKAFCNYFANIGNELESSIPTVSKSPLDYIDKSFSDSFFIFPTYTSEIEKEISNLNSNKSVGPCSIPVRVLKIINCVISKPLEIIFNFSFSTGIVPNSFKTGMVAPVV
jgi:hypothetical protein